MKTRRTWGIIFIIAGAAMLFFSEYIAREVSQGKQELKSGKRQVKEVESIFSVSKYTKPFGEAVTSGAHKKIQKGEGDITYYDMVARNLRIVGIILIGIGFVLIFFSKKK